ncbi:hypothetical protein LEP1GSC043_0119 [Leptospira weilii str. Ecochallenge]|uniref:VCBS repeat protein n=1 Tax=Leptospira weilii str. Ecochallenge TaxID=1049986 RepID=N1UJS0_9LEPT|nr:hypothetical protein LEP1GSC043_0119 [Leptospira weilii str. Ecochallenge]
MEEDPNSTQYFEGDYNGDGISDLLFLIRNRETGKPRKAEKKEDTTSNCTQTVIKDTIR